MSANEQDTLAARLARGEEAAFAELYDACADRLHHYLAVRLGCREAASDVLQNAFLKAVKNRRQFRGVDNPIAYLFQIARNEAARAIRKRYPSSLSVEDVFTTNGDATAEQEDIELAAMALQKLDSDEREIVELKIYSGLTFREIADVTRLPQGTAATKYRRALESLRSWLAKQLR